MDTKWGSIGPGWDKLVQPLIDLCETENVDILQIKEKFGGLRFYIARGASETLWHIIAEAEHRSLSTCEECGESGTRVSINGWLKTLCGVHDDDFNRWVAEVRAKAGK